MSEAWQDKMWGVLQHSYLQDHEVAAETHRPGVVVGETGADLATELKFDQPTEEVLLEWEYRRQAGSPQSPEPLCPEQRTAELPAEGKWLQDLKSGLMHRGSAQAVRQQLAAHATHATSPGPLSHPSCGPDGETWRWVARLAHLPVHALEADETVALAQLLREGLSDATRIPQASVAVVLSPGGADSTLVSAYIHGNPNAASRLLEDELWHVKEELASSPALLRASDGRVLLCDARLTQVTPEDGYVHSADVKGVLGIVRTHDTVLGLDAATLTPDSALLLATSKPSLAQALSYGTALNDDQVSTERLEQHLWQLSSEYENMLAMALERRSIANPDSAGPGANLAAVRKACQGLEPEGISPSLAEVLAPAVAREVEVAEIARAVEDAKLDVSSATRRLQLLAEECSSLHSELSHFRSHAALQIQQIGLRQSISALEADLADRGMVESRLQLECSNLEAQTQHSVSKATNLKAEVDSLRQQVYGRRSTEEALLERPHSHAGASVIDDLQQLRADIAKLRARVTPRNHSSAVLGGGR